MIWAKRFKQFVTQIMVLFAFRPQAFAIERDRRGVFDDVRMEFPADTEAAATTSPGYLLRQSLHHDWAALRREDFQRHFP